MWCRLQGGSVFLNHLGHEAFVAHSRQGAIHEKQKVFRFQVALFGHLFKEIVVEGFAGVTGPGTNRGELALQGSVEKHVAMPLVLNKTLPFKSLLNFAFVTLHLRLRLTVPASMPLSRERPGPAVPRPQRRCCAKGHPGLLRS